MNGDSVARRLLEERGLFSFDESDRYAIDQFFGESGFATDDLALPVELTYLTAAEFALAQFFMDPRPVLEDGPVQVFPGTAAIALAKTNCLFLEYCSSADFPAPLRLVDVTAFSGDVAKLQTLGISNEEPPSAPGALAEVVRELQQRHIDSPAALARQIGMTGVIRFQGFLWAVKLSLPGGDLPRAFAEAEEAFGLGAEGPATL